MVDRPPAGMFAGSSVAQIERNNAIRLSCVMIYFSNKNIIPFKSLLLF